MFSGNHFTELLKTPEEKRETGSRKYTDFGIKLPILKSANPEFEIGAIPLLYSLQSNSPWKTEA